jgi:hypothetical protein
MFIASAPRHNSAKLRRSGMSPRQIRRRSHLWAPSAVRQPMAPWGLVRVPAAHYYRHSAPNGASSTRAQMNRRQFILISAGLCCLGFLIVILAPRGPWTPAFPTASVSFVGFTNLPGKGRCAMFCFTNASTTQIALTVDSFDEEIAGDWVNRRLTTNLGNNNIQSINRSASWLKGFAGFQDSLPPRASFVFCVPPPSFVGWQDLGPDEGASFYIPSPVWRVRFLCQAREPKDAFREFFGTATPNSTLFPNKPNAFFHYQVFSGTRAIILSPEVRP